MGIELLANYIFIIDFLFYLDLGQVQNIKKYSYEFTMIIWV